VYKAAGALGHLPVEIVMMVERILHDTTTFTEGDIPVRHKFTNKERQNTTPRRRPFNKLAWLACKRGRCTHETSLGCEDQWLILRLDQNGKCLEVWYGAIEESDVLEGPK
jgi:hypothetical protein